MSGIAERTGKVRERIVRAAERAGRGAGDVRLMAVSKTRPVEDVLEAVGAGLALFGENRVQEAAAKFPSVLARGGAELHMIGNLQGNKAKLVPGLFSCVQSVSSESLLRELSKRAAAAGVVLDILLELHTGEDSKSGFADEGALLRAADLSARLPALRLRGLMTMAPYTDDAAPIRAAFRKLAALYRRMAGEGRGEGFDTLSMGMTNDYEIAVEEGSTLLRIGSAIFSGEREGVRP